MSWDRQAVVAGRVYARSQTTVVHVGETDPAAHLALGSVFFFMVAAIIGLWIFAFS